MMSSPVLPRLFPAPLRKKLRIGFQLALWLGLLWAELFLIVVVRSRLAHPQAGRVVSSTPNHVIEE